MTETMQFRSFLFPHNPASITVTRVGETVAHFCPGRGEVLQRLGGRGRKVVCKGCFYGSSFEEANSHLSQLLEAAASGEPGALFLPGYEPFLACLSELVTEASGDGKVIPYAMTFLEAEVKA